MKIANVKARAFAMPLMNPAYPRGPYKFYGREFVILSYRTDPALLREVVPEPLEPAGDTVSYEFIRMPDSTGFGDYTESGQVIPVRYRGEAGSYTHQMFLNDHPPIAAGRGPPTKDTRYGRPWDIAIALPRGPKRLQVLDRAARSSPHAGPSPAGLIAGGDSSSVDSGRMVRRERAARSTLTNGTATAMSSRSVKP